MKRASAVQRFFLEDGEIEIISENFRKRMVDFCLTILYDSKYVMINKF